MAELKYTDTLVATLGGQPQVITFTLDLLLRQGVSISEVIVISPNPSTPRLQNSLACLNREFIGDRYKVDGRSLTCHFRPKILELHSTPIDDISNNTSALGTRETIYHFIQELKQQPRHIHLSVTGGRRMMSLMAISAAQLKFGPFDHIWHIYTPDALKEEVKEGRRMHAPPNSGVCLIEVPFLPIEAYFPNVSQMADSAEGVERTQKAHMDAQERACCDYVAKEATRRQLEVLRAFARGLNTQGVAQELGREIKTVHSHKSVLLDLCKIAWNLPRDKQLNYTFLQTKFARYFKTN